METVMYIPADKMQPLAAVVWFWSSILAAFFGVIALVATWALNTSGSALSEASNREMLALRQNLATTQQKTEELKLENSKLDIELAKVRAPLLKREVTLEQKTKLKDVIFGKILGIGIFWPTTETEVAEYAHQLREAFAEAGATINIEGGAESRMSVGKASLLGNGLSVVGGPEPSRSLLMRALSAANIVFDVRESLPGVQFGVPLLIVGSRPPITVNRAKGTLQ